MRAVELCAGAGGASLGCQWAGFDVHGIEIDADAVLTHRAMVGPCDRSEVECWHPERGFTAELVGGGVPCPDFSPAGNRAGLTSERGRLYEHVLRIADEVDADAVWIENSDGITTWRNDAGITAAAFIEADFRARGWHTTSAVLCAADFGVPQKRYRWILIGFRTAAMLGAFRWPSPTHGEAWQLLGLLPWVTVRQALQLGGEPYVTGRIEGAKNWSGERRVDVDSPATTVTASASPDLLALDRPAPTIVASDGAMYAARGKSAPGKRRLAELAEAVDSQRGIVLPQTHRLGSERCDCGHIRDVHQGPDDSDCTDCSCCRFVPSGDVDFARLDAPAPVITACASNGMTRSKTRRSQRPLAEMAHAIAGVAGQGQRVVDPDQPAPSVTTTRAPNLIDQPALTLSAGGTLSGGGVEVFANQDYRAALASELAAAGLIDRPATTISAQADGRVAQAGHHVRQQKGAVRLTARQCATLQGFPESFEFTGNKSSQHAQIGNAFPPRFAEAVFRSVREALVSEQVRGAA